MLYKSKKLLKNLKDLNFLPALDDADRDILIEALESSILATENNRVSYNRSLDHYENDCGDANEY
jgi:hypothetical protein